MPQGMGSYKFASAMLLQATRCAEEVTVGGRFMVTSGDSAQRNPA